MPDLNNAVHKTVPVLLVVDASVDALALILQQHGYSVLTASNSEDALLKLEFKRVDAVIVDHHTMQLEGIDLPASIKQLWPEMPVLMLSSAHPVDSAPPGVDIFLSKVEPPTRVLETVAILLARSRQI